MKLLQSKERNPLKRKAAFTLVEVVISMAIIALMSIALFSGITQGLAVISIARENLRATQIMVEKIELLRLYSWTELNTPGFVPAAFAECLMPSTATNSSTVASRVEDLTAPSGAGTIFVGTISLETPSINPAYDDSMRLATLTVTWTNGNIVRTRSMQTLVAEKGIHDYIF
jgi:prepilin-type N-terminal cleavage/methylation domain-containing protein